MTLVPTPVRAPGNAVSAAYPLRLNTGRLRDQWHTMTRTARSARLSAHIDQPQLAVHPADAARHRLQNGALARVTSLWGTAVLRVQVSTAQTPGDVFAPIHWGSTHASAARIGAVVNPVVDPLSGEPEFKHTPVTVTPFAARWYGFALMRHPPETLPTLAWWSRVQGAFHTRLEFAGDRPLANITPWLRRFAPGLDGEWIEASDPARQRYQGAAVIDERLEAVVFVAPTPTLPSRQWLAGLFALDRLERHDRTALLAGRPADPGVDQGPVVCACFGVGRNCIIEAIRAHQLTTAAAVGQHLKAGTNCGSCVPEISALLR